MTIDRGIDNAIGPGIVSQMTAPASAGASSGSAAPAVSPKHIGPLAGVFISAAISAVSSLISAGVSKHNADKQMAWQTREQEKQNKWQEEQWEKSAEYNRPVNQMKRFREAGINPSIMFDSGSGSMSGQTSPMSAAGSGVSSVGLPQPPSLLQSGDIGNLASSLKAIADAKKAGVETSRLEAFTDAELENLTLDATIKKFSLQLDQMFEGKKRTAEINQIIEDANLKMNQAFTAAEQGYNFKVESALKELEKQLLESKIKKGYVDIFINNMKREGQLLAAQTKNQNASAANQYASAENQRAQAYSARELGQKTRTERLEIVSNAIALYEDEFGVHIDEQKAQQLRDNLMHQMDNVIRQQGQDYWNPFRYVGHVLGAGGNLSVQKAIK